MLYSNNLDVLMITHNRLEYLKKALPSVVNQEGIDFRITVWDNGSTDGTWGWLNDWLSEQNQVPVILHKNPVNESLSSVTSRYFLASDCEFVGKVDADTIVPFDWAHRLIHAHQQHHLGFIGGFHFRKEDLEGLKPNIEDFSGVKLWRKHHIGGCAFIIRRDDFKGYSGKGVMGLSEYQAEMGLPNGYLWDPILWVDHMEDARSEHYINTEEYNQYKLKTRGVDLSLYQSGIVNEVYMKENTL